MRKVIALAATLAAAILSWIVMAPAGHASTPGNCNGIYNNTSFSTIIVSADGFCAISNSTVTGAVIVNKNAEFFSCNSSIGGSLTASRAYVNIDNDSSIKGSITLNQPGASNLIGVGPCNTRGSSEYAGLLCPEYVGGSINVQNGPWSENGVSIGDCGFMEIYGAVNIIHNRLPVDVFGANIYGSLNCIDNWPPAYESLDYVKGANSTCEQY